METEVAQELNLTNHMKQLRYVQTRRFVFSHVIRKCLTGLNWQPDLQEYLEPVTC